MKELSVADFGYEYHKWRPPRRTTGYQSGIYDNAEAQTLARAAVRMGSQIFHALSGLLSQKGYAGVGDGWFCKLLNNKRGFGSLWKRSDWRAGSQAGCVFGAGCGCVGFIGTVVIILW